MSLVGYIEYELEIPDDRKENESYIRYRWTQQQIFVHLDNPTPPFTRSYPSQPQGDTSCTCTQTSMHA